MDKFNHHKKEIERKDIELLFNYLGHIVEPASNNNFDNVDYICRDLNWVIELKSRNFNIKTLKEQYNGQLLIEVKKYEAMFKRAEELGLNPVYISKLNDGHYFIYNLKKVPIQDLNSQNVYAPKVSLSNNKQYTNKESYLLKTEYPKEVLWIKKVTKEKLEEKLNAKK